MVLLHGIGASAMAWEPLAQALAGQPVRVVALDLLGFGNSPKPLWPDYAVDDHARSVIAAIKRQRLGAPAILVGHSMGCLVAVRVARLRPDLVRYLVLYEMPLYAGLPKQRRYTVRRDMYFWIYQRIIDMPPPQPGLVDHSPALRRAITRLTGLDMDSRSWLPFVRSLQHTIIEQNTLQDIRQLRVPMDIVYGSLDVLVIRGRARRLFGPDSAHIATYTITQQHRITQRAGRFLAHRILGGLKN